jgi:hypothetical protein
MNNNLDWHLQTQNRDYLDLSVNKELYKSVKYELKSMIRSTKL